MSLRSSSTTTFELISNTEACMGILLASQNASTASLPADLSLAFSAVYCLRYQFVVNGDCAHLVYNFNGI